MDLGDDGEALTGLLLLLLLLLCSASSLNKV